MFSQPSFTKDLAIKTLTGQAQKIYNNYQEDKKGLTQNAFKAAYAISMPLLANAQTLNQKNYDILLPKMISALENLQDKSLAAWLWGRIYAAARHIGDAKNAETAKNTLKKLLDSAVEKNAFITWAWGYYLADENNGEYKSCKETMFKAASDLAAAYLKEPTQDRSTDAMWAWVMAIQAAANNGDSDMYENIKIAMKKMTGQATLALALEKGLSEGDYPAWAMSIVSAAALKLKKSDEELSASMEKMTRQAKNAGRIEEFMLAYLTSTTNQEKNIKVSYKLK